MKNYILPILLATLLFAGGYYFGRSKPVTTLPPKLTLEEILSIRELHLVKHTYNDLFFLHKHNDPRKPIRAIVYVPVEVSAYLNLKMIEVIKQGDSVKHILLPKAQLNEVHYRMDQMTLRETRSFQLHVGNDLYPAVGKYLQSALAARMDSVKNMAVAQRILLQAEEEGKAYVKHLLQSIGRGDVRVSVQGEGSSGFPTAFQSSPKVLPNVSGSVETIPFGFVPLY